MIKYNLKCENKHEFESWFSNSSEFDKLNKKKIMKYVQEKLTPSQRKFIKGQ